MTVDHNYFLIGLLYGYFPFIWLGIFYVMTGCLLINYVINNLCMKKCIRIFVVILGVIFFVACGNKVESVYQDETCIEWEDFESQELTGREIAFDEPVMQPNQLVVMDTLLITINRKTEKLLHLFNLNTKKQIGEHMTRGEGPNEMISPSFILGQDSVRLYDMVTSAVCTYGVGEFVSAPSLVPSRRYKLSEADFFSELVLLKDKLVGVSYRPDAPCYMFNAAGQKIGAIGNYPEGPEAYTDLERVDAYRAIPASNGNDRFAVCHFFTDLIDIYSDSGKLVKRLYGPEHFFTRFTEFNDGVQIGSRPNPDYYRDAFYSPVGVGDELWVLYNGKFVNKPGYNLLAKDILVFSWEGVPLRHYILNDGVSRIAVNPEKRKIYGISSDPEYHIVEYSY